MSPLNVSLMDTSPKQALLRRSSSLGALEQEAVLANPGPAARPPALPPDGCCPLQTEPSHCELAAAHPGCAGTENKEREALR